MQKPSDDRLIAYLDGELAEGERAEIALWLERDEALRERAAHLTESAALLRSALDEVLREPVPERLIAAARGGTAATVTDLGAARAARTARRFGDRRWWAGMAAAASIVGVMIGSGIGYFVGTEPTASDQLASAGWLDNAAVYHNLYVNAGADDDHLGFDVAAGQKLPQNFRVPNLKPWGLDFQGVRYLIIEGRPATQLFYTTDNKALGPLTVVVAKTSKPDVAPTMERHGDVNLLYWRHHGNAYALVGTANYGYLWNIHNDIAYQLDAI
jgi:anti-sigma factor RsiW